MDFLSEFPDEEAQTKEIYARFGLAVYLASVFEESVAIAATMLALVAEYRAQKITTESEWQTRHDEEMLLAHSLPLGRGLSRLTALLDHAGEFQDLGKEVLMTRNYLVHHFFRDEIHEFYTAEGRLRMHEKLMTSIALFSRADKELMAATSSLRQRLGMTDEKLAQSYDELQAEFRQR